MLLRLCQVARFYGPRLIFKDVSLEIEPGTVTLLAGANGAGKSTLMKIMAGMIRPSSGTVVPCSESGREPRTGFLGHQTFLYPDLTARENLQFWSAMHGNSFSGADFDNILQRVELSSFAEEKARTFSRGMAQRLNLARVFLLSPELLLLDEPSTGLDSRSTVILHREIAAAKARDAAVVWITHSLAADLQRADMVALLENKKLSYYGPARSCPLSTEAAALFDSTGSTEGSPSFETPLEARGGELC